MRAGKHLRYSFAIVCLQAILFAGATAALSGCGGNGESTKSTNAGSSGAKGAGEKTGPKKVASSEATASAKGADKSGPKQVNNQEQPHDESNEGPAAETKSTEPTEGRSDSSPSAGRTTDKDVKKQEEVDELQNITIDGVSALAAIVIGSFAIDRIVTGLLFLLSFFSFWTKYFPDPAAIADDDDPPEEKANLIVPSEESAPQTKTSAKIRRGMAKKRLKLVYYVFAGVLGIGLIAYLGDVRIFTILGFKGINKYLDYLMTGLILMAGADWVAGVLKLPGAPAKPSAAPSPVEITGRLVLEDETDDKKVTATAKSPGA